MAAIACSERQRRSGPAAPGSERPRREHRVVVAVPPPAQRNQNAACAKQARHADAPAPPSTHCRPAVLQRQVRGELRQNGVGVDRHPIGRHMEGAVGECGREQDRKISGEHEIGAVCRAGFVQGKDGCLPIRAQQAPGVGIVASQAVGRTEGRSPVKVASRTAALGGASGMRRGAGSDTQAARASLRALPGSPLRRIRSPSSGTHSGGTSPRAGRWRAAPRAGRARRRGWFRDGWA